MKTSEPIEPDLQTVKEKWRNSNKRARVGTPLTWGFTCEGRLSVGEEAAALRDLHRRLVQALRVERHRRAPPARVRERERVVVVGLARVQLRVAQHPPQLVLP